MTTGACRACRLLWATRQVAQSFRDDRCDDVTNRKNTEDLLGHAISTAASSADTNELVTHMMPLIRELHKVNVLGELPTRAPGQTASVRRGVVLGHVRRLQTESKALGPIAAAERSEAYIVEVDKLQLARDERKKLKAEKAAEKTAATSAASAAKAEKAADKAAATSAAKAAKAADKAAATSAAKAERAASAKVKRAASANVAHSTL